MRFGSLFDGIYGFGLGFESAGHECTWRSEIEPNCNKLMELRRPGVPSKGDIRGIGKRNLEPVDIVVGGFPCQDVSVAGKRAGLAGERSGLWFEFHRVLAELEPQFVVIENVPGLLSSNKGRDFAIILRGLVELGYGVCWRVLDAQHFGVPQRRRRVFIVGSLGDGRAAEILFERESSGGHTTQSGEAREEVAKPLGASSGERGWPNDLDHGAFVTGAVLSKWAKGTGGPSGDEVQNLVASPITAWHVGESNKWPPINEASNLVTGSLQGSGASTARSGNERSEADMLVAFTLPASVRGTGDGHGNGWNSNYVTPALTGSERGTGRTGESRGQDPVIAQQAGVRRLTPTECERLQGFPDGWTDGFADSVRYRMLGNAVAVPVISWLAQRVK